MRAPHVQNNRLVLKAQPCHTSGQPHCRGHTARLARIVQPSETHAEKRDAGAWQQGESTHRYVMLLQPLQKSAGSAVS